MMHPKPTRTLVSPKLRQSAMGRPCSLRWASGCNDQDVVLAHVRGIWSGVAQKPHDIFACYACGPCNKAMEGANRPPPREVLRAVFETWDHWLASGLIKV